MFNVLDHLAMHKILLIDLSESNIGVSTFDIRDSFLVIDDNYETLTNSLISAFPSH